MAEAITPNAPTNPMTLRPATPSDGLQIASLYSTLFSDTFGYSLPPSDLSAYIQTVCTPPSGTIFKDLANPNITFIVACLLGQEELVIGFAQMIEGTMEECVREKESPVELQRLYVSGEWSGKGVGSLLMRRVMEVAREKGKKTLWLGVWGENLKAQAVYRKLGFERVGEHDFVTGTCVQTDWILCTNL